MRRAAGLAAALAAGLAISLLHAICCVRFRADNIIVGLSINLLAGGSTNFLLKRIFNSSSNSYRCATFSSWTVFDPAGSLAPLNQLAHPLILIIALVFVASHLLLYHTRFGLRLRSVGENPHAADSLGVSVTLYRSWGVLLGGMIASLGGVWLASDQGLFSSMMTNGRGYIALAVDDYRQLETGGSTLDSIIFGFAEAMKDQLQILQQQWQHAGADALAWWQRVLSGIPVRRCRLSRMCLTITVTAGFIGRSTPPAADGVPFEKTG